MLRGGGGGRVPPKSNLRSHAGDDPPPPNGKKDPSNPLKHIFSDLNYAQASDLWLKSLVLASDSQNEEEYSCKFLFI